MHKFETEEEVKIMLAIGMKQISKETFFSIVQECGYTPEKDMYFNYINSANERTYLAKCVSNYKDNISGLSAFHYKGRKDERFARLQDMRLNCFVYDGTRIWEL